MSTDSPGALAVADVDRMLTPDATYGATYNDEAVVAYEVQDTGATAQVQLDVVSYVAAPGQATVVGIRDHAATNTGTFAYPCNLSSVRGWQLHAAIPAISRSRPAIWTATGSRISSCLR